ncbi:CFEM domain-containing protein [Mycena venus]|uniref:CFEM domain-containing protein n=1 Tax=Mycena venus TaxID=2733690 RepID=A0A8H6XJ69_9AGAR|nr:CFEM domain-containing protein [Mycena venus]
MQALDDIGLAPATDPPKMNIYINPRPKFSPHCSLLSSKKKTLLLDSCNTTRMRFTLFALLALSSSALAHWHSSAASSGSAASHSGSGAIPSSSSAPHSSSGPTHSGSGAIPSSSPAIPSGSASISNTGSAAIPSSSAQLTPCALNCLAAAASASECGTPTNLTCVCTNPDFQYKAASCLKAECRPAEGAAVLDMQASQCYGLSATGAPTATAPFTPSNSAADISASVPASGSSSVRSGSASGEPGSPASSSSSPRQSGNTGGAVALWSGNGLVLATLTTLFGGVLGAIVV